MPKQQAELNNVVIRRMGWEILVKNFGIVNATRFLLQYDSGMGDYVKIKRQIFKNKAIKQIQREIKEGKI